VASPDGAEGSVTIHADARLYAGLFDGTEAATLALDPARKAYVHLVRGRLTVNGQALAGGDAALLSGEASLALTGGEPMPVFDLAPDFPLHTPTPEKRNPTMSKIVVVFHSGYGHTQRLAEAVAKGAGADLLAIDAEGNLPEAAWAALNAADAIVMGTDLHGHRELAVQEVRRRLQQGLVHPGVEGQGVCRLHQQRHDERRQAVDAALPVHPGHAAQRDLGGHRPDAVQQQGPAQ
jgi:hypothetical protein